MSSKGMTVKPKEYSGPGPLERAYHDFCEELQLQSAAKPETKPDSCLGIELVMNKIAGLGER